MVTGLLELHTTAALAVAAAARAAAVRFMVAVAVGLLPELLDLRYSAVMVEREPA